MQRRSTCQGNGFVCMLVSVRVYVYEYHLIHPLLQLKGQKLKTPFCCSCKNQITSPGGVEIIVDVITYEKTVFLQN